MIFDTKSENMADQQITAHDTQPSCGSSSGCSCDTNSPSHQNKRQKTDSSTSIIKLRQTASTPITINHYPKSSVCADFISENEHLKLSGTDNWCEIPYAVIRISGKKDFLKRDLSSL